MYYFLLLLFFIPNLILANDIKYFQQEVNYVINVTLDDKKHELNGNIEIEYINNSPNNLKEIFFHLWPNAYQDKTTALCKQKIKNKDTDLYYAHTDDRGYIDNLNFYVNGDPVKYEFNQDNTLEFDNEYRSPGWNRFKKNSFCRKPEETKGKPNQIQGNLTS